MANIAFVFPGQGSQSQGMLDAWAAEFPSVRETIEEANAALGFDLGALIATGPAEELNQTEITQPAMLLADIALWRVWQAEGGATPVVLAGHSLGEFAALVAAEVLSFEQAIRLVRFRAQQMQAAVPQGEGAMAAVIGMADAALQALCQELAGDEVLEPVNFNADGQVVVAGHASAVQRLVEQGKAAGARMVKPLPVSVPAHSSLMQSAAQALQQEMQNLDFATPQIPVLHNVDAATHDAAEIPGLLARQVRSPVQWVQTMQSMQRDFAVDLGLECGPGQVLAGLAKRGMKGTRFQALKTPDDLRALLAEQLA